MKSHAKTTVEVELKELRYAVRMVWVAVGTEVVTLLALLWIIIHVKGYL